MDHLTLHSILSCQFRANPDYELVLFDRLPEEQKELLKGLENERDFYGVLRPREAAGLGVKSVDRDTALLFLSLQQPGPLPAYVVRMNGSQANRAMAELVLSDVLQVAVDGTFASSAGAWNLICAEEPLSAEGGTIARLSLAALKYAQALQLNDVQRLSARLYFYNRAPLSPRWRRQLPNPEAVRCYLGIEDGETSEDMLFSLETIACLGACALSPVMVVDGKYYGKMTPQRVGNILQQLSQEDKD